MCICMRGWGGVSHQRPGWKGHWGLGGMKSAGAVREEGPVRWGWRSGGRWGQLVNHAEDSDFYCKKKLGRESPEQYQEGGT